jgi:hypothetical protein
VELIPWFSAGWRWRASSGLDRDVPQPFRKYVGIDQVAEYQVSFPLGKARHTGFAQRDQLSTSRWAAGFPLGTSILLVLQTY